MEELRYKVRDAISFWEVNDTNVQNVSPTLRQYDSHAPAKVGNCSDEDFVKNSEEVLKLHLQLDIFKTILVEEKVAHAEVEQRTNALGEEVKRSRYEIEGLESDLARSLNESAELRKSNNQALEKDEVCRQAEVETVDVIISLQQQLDASKKNELLIKENLGKLQLENNQMKESIISMGQELASKSLELADLVSDRKLLEAQMLENNEKLAALVGDLAKTSDVLNIVSLENAELKSQLERIGRNSCTVEELAHKNAIIGKLEEDLIELESLRNELSKLSDEKQCCETQVRIFKWKLEMAHARITESESIATKAQAQQIAEKWKAYAEEKDKKIELLERSNEDLEITICELENKVNINEEAKYERIQREEQELKLQNIKRPKLVVPSFGNANCSRGDEMVNLVDSIRHSQDIQNELLGAQEVSESKPEIGPVDVTEPPMVGTEPDPQTDDPDEPSEESYLDEGLLEPKQPDMEMEAAYSSNEYYRPVVEIMEENELPPSAPVRPNVPVDYMRAPSDMLKRVRSRNHYEGKRTATDRRFWSIEQQDLYTSIYSRVELADMKWIDWEHIDSIEQFSGIRKRFAYLGLERIMSYYCHWDSELIRQFYCTVHISADRTWMTWMTDGRKITTNKRAWEERFNIPSGAHNAIHSQLFLNDADMRILYTAAEHTLGHINGLSPLASIVNKILGTTIYPRFGSTPRIGNTTHIWNVLYHIVEQHQFDIISLIFGEIESLISDQNRTKDKLLYAPYIMGMIMRAFEYEGPRESRHGSYKPRPYKPKLSTKSHPRAAPAVVSLGKAAPLEPTLSAFQPEVPAAGREAYVEPVDVDDHHQFEAYRDPKTTSLPSEQPNVPLVFQIS